MKNLAMASGEESLVTGCMSPAIELGESVGW